MIPFISDDDLSAYLETTVTSADLITLIALDAACQAVRDALHRQINLATEATETLSGSGTGALVLRNRPIVELTTVTIDDEEVDQDNIYVDAGAGILYLTDGTSWGWGLGNITVEYDHGYALNESDLPEDADMVRVPSSIRLVALKLAAAIWRAKGPTSTGGAVSEEHIGTYQYRVQVTDAAKLAAQYITPEDMNTMSSNRNAVLA